MPTRLLHQLSLEASFKVFRRYDFYFKGMDILFTSRAQNWILNQLCWRLAAPYITFIGLYILHVVRKCTKQKLGKNSTIVTFKFILPLRTSLVPLVPFSFVVHACPSQTYKSSDCERQWWTELHHLGWHVPWHLQIECAVKDLGK